MPLLLIGHVVDNPERDARQAKRKQLEAFSVVWLQLHGSIEEVQALDP